MSQILGKLPIASAHHWSGLCLLLTFSIILNDFTKQRPKCIFFLLFGSVIKITYMKSRREGEKIFDGQVESNSNICSINGKLDISRKWTNWIIHEAKVKSIHLYLNQILSNSLHGTKYAVWLIFTNILCKQRRKTGNLVNPFICNRIALTH